MFRPEITERFTAPIELHLASEPLTLSKREIAHEGMVKTRKLLLSLEVDHGKIREIDS